MNILVRLVNKLDLQPIGTTESFSMTRNISFLLKQAPTGHGSD